MPYLVPYLHWCANMVANMAFTAFATGLLRSKHIFALYLRCANLMQIHFFVQCLISYSCAALTREISRISTAT